MNRRSFLGLTLAATAPIAGMGGTARAQIGKRPPLVLIVARNSPLQQLSMTQLRGLFLGDTVKDGAGNKLIPLNHPAGAPDRVAFDRLVLRMSPEQVGRFWVDHRIRGEGRPPRTVDSPALLQRLVGRLPGSVAYVRGDRIDPSVHILPIDGRIFTQAGYPLID